MHICARSPYRYSSHISSAQVKEYKADLAALKEQMNKAQLALPVGDAARAELVRGVDWEGN